MEYECEVEKILERKDFLKAELQETIFETGGIIYTLIKKSFEFYLSCKNMIFFYRNL